MIVLGDTCLSIRSLVRDDRRSESDFWSFQRSIFHMMHHLSAYSRGCMEPSRALQAQSNLKETRVLACACVQHDLPYRAWLFQLRRLLRTAT